MRGRSPRPAPSWTPRKLVALLALGVTLLLLGMILAGLELSKAGGYRTRGSIPSSTPDAVADPRGPAPTAGDARPAGGLPGVATKGGRSSGQGARDALADRPMREVDAGAARPMPVTTRDPRDPIVLPAPAETGPAGVPSGFPQTPEGAMAQLAAIDQVALQSGSLLGVRTVIEQWAMPGGPDGTTWSGVSVMAGLLNSMGLSAGGSPQVQVLLTPLMGLIKGNVGDDFVVPCVLFEADVTYAQTARAGAADCQRMVWNERRWMIGPGREPALAPSVWPGSDLAIEVGYRELRRG